MALRCCCYTTSIHSNSSTRPSGTRETPSRTIQAPPFHRLVGLHSLFIGSNQCGCKKMHFCYWQPGFDNSRRVLYLSVLGVRHSEPAHGLKFDRQLAYGKPHRYGIPVFIHKVSWFLGGPFALPSVPSTSTKNDPRQDPWASPNSNAELPDQIRSGHFGETVFGGRAAGFDGAPQQEQYDAAVTARSLAGSTAAQSERWPSVHDADGSGALAPLATPTGPVPLAAPLSEAGA